MFKHNCLLIFRSAKRFKSVFLINVIGLTSGLACTLLIYMWVTDEMAIDQFLTNKDRLYYVWENRIKADGLWTSRNTAGPMAAEMKADFPDVEAACRVRSTELLLSVDDKKMNVRGAYADDTYFKLFDYPFTYGNPQSALSDKKSIVISESLAIKLFGNVSGVINKTINRDQFDDMTVVGVMKDYPSTASEKYEYIIPMKVFEDEHDYVKTWGSTGLATFVLLDKGVSPDEFNKKLDGYVSKKTGDPSGYRNAFLKKYSDIYLYGNYEDGKLVGGRISYVTMFSIIAIFILVIACINFMNLSTAKASRRLKEVGIKKAVGAPRSSLVLQYMGESIVTSLIAVSIALLVVDLLLGNFNVLTGKNLHFTWDLRFVSAVIGIGVGAGLLAGSYPALYLSGFKPYEILKGRFTSSTAELWARKGLVGFQFALSVILIVSVVIVHKQLTYIQEANLGYNRENLFYTYRTGQLWEQSKLEAFISETRRIPGVLNVSATAHNMTGHHSGTWRIIWPGKDENDRTEFEHIAVDADMMETFDIKLVSGRFFKKGSVADTGSLVINEAGLKLMGLKDPIGTHVTMWGRDREIIGVCKDFHYESLHENFKPAVFRFTPEDTEYVMIKVDGKQTPATIAAVQGAYERINPGFPFDYHFMDASYQSLYESEARVDVLSRYFAGLAIVISCLGLFALASFTAERRLKEIGIRKVLGSSDFQIVYLLSSDFTKIVLVAIVIALPIGYLLTKSWLDGFAFKTSLSPMYFIGAGVLSLVIAWFTVGIQAFKASRVNPSKCLKED